MGMVSVAVELATGMPESWQRRQVGGNQNEYGIDLLTHVGALCEAVPRASSAESVGKFWFGQVAKCVIQSDFQCPGGAEPVW